LERARRILVTPLDWGLGHATRCIPLINALLQRNAEIIIAGSGPSAELLKNEFPNQKHFNLPAYAPQYPANGNMVWTMARQLPHFIKTINAEYARVVELIKKERVDVVISDNRYGCHVPGVKSIFIYHQLNLLMPHSYKWMQGTVNYFNQKQINKFDECWIPATDNQLLGSLLPTKLSPQTRFIGYLSRFKKQDAETKYDIVAIGSGPEPQRKMLVDLLRDELRANKLKAFLVRGDVDGPEQINTVDNLTEANYLNSDKLNSVINQSNIVLARSGYSTIMDMAKLGKKAIFIPTPGQTEQAYLAAQLRNKGIAFSMEQFDFNLKTAIKEANKFSGFTNFGYDESLLQQAIQSVL
jgi:uncharacterized protein (TIGR00661 family)